MIENRDELIPTRWSLVQRLKDAGDHQSWREFFDCYRNLIFGVAVKSGLTETEAEEVVQETVISVAQKMPEFKANSEAGSFKGWLLLITRRRIADQFRARRPDFNRPAEEEDRTRTPLLEQVADPASVNMEAMWDQEWHKNLISTALQKLRSKVSLKQLQIYDLYAVKQWPVRKVANALNVNLGEVYLAKHRVSRLLRHEIKKLEENFM